MEKLMTPSLYIMHRKISAELPYPPYFRILIILKPVSQFIIFQHFKFVFCIVLKLKRRGRIGTGTSQKNRYLAEE